ncbi:MAG: YggS family pyridoxal phosphate-dependent enzyme [Clostridiales bacterium]|nr:YggS family pyridoxal phosphate-dependent enzyme [Clostridiales bacterium]
MLAERIAAIRDTLERESAPWGRTPKLIAVTKYSTVEEILPLSELGVTDIGENRVQALREKIPFLGGKFSLHLIGRLQTNKVKYIINDVCMIHSLDSMPLAQEIDRQAKKNGRQMPVLIEVNIAREPQKGGVMEEDLFPFLRACAGLDGMKVKGLMAMMPLGADADVLTGYFSRMRTLLDRCREEAVPGTDMTELSMGMSQDYAIAARCGATMVRIGSAIFR